MPPPGGPPGLQLTDTICSYKVRTALHPARGPRLVALNTGSPATSSLPPALAPPPFSPDPGNHMPLPKSCCQGQWEGGLGDRNRKCPLHRAGMLMCAASPGPHNGRGLFSSEAGLPSGSWRPDSQQPRHCLAEQGPQGFLRPRPDFLPGLGEVHPLPPANFSLPQSFPRILEPRSKCLRDVTTATPT